jgi:hypothetical protein
LYSSFPFCDVAALAGSGLANLCASSGAVHSPPVCWSALQDINDQTAKTVKAPNNETGNCLVFFIIIQMVFSFGNLEIIIEKQIFYFQFGQDHIMERK